MAFVGKLKGFDLHPKFREEFMEKTRSGGVGTAGITPNSPAEWFALISCLRPFRRVALQ